jgi:hypothetical protein
MVGKVEGSRPVAGVGFIYQMNGCPKAGEEAAHVGGVGACAQGDRFERVKGHERLEPREQTV